MHQKDIPGWSNLKLQIDKDSNRPLLKVREVCWCSIGHNIGSEMDGKGTAFARPVLILKFLSSNTVLVLPLTHTQKIGRHIYNLEFNNEIVQCRLDQVRVVDTKRLRESIGRLSEKKFGDISYTTREFLFPKRKEQNVSSYVGAKAIIKNENNEILIVKEIWGGKWGLPGGRVNEDEIQEDLKTILLREIEEELGANFKVKVLNFFDTMFRKFVVPQNPDVTSAFALFYVCEYLGGEISIQKEELCDYKWVGKNNLEDLEFINGYKNMLNKYFIQN